MHIIAAKAVAFKEALSPEFKTYQEQILKNAKAMADRLIKRGLRLVSGGTDNHMMLINLVGSGVNGKQLETWLDMAHITANKNTVPNDPASPFVTSGLRVGTPAVTSRGFGTAEMKQIAGFLTDILRDPEGSSARVAEEVAALCARFPIYSC